MDYKELGKRIGELRRELGLTQKELADMLGVTDKAVSKWETGRSLPDPALLLPLAARLHTTVDRLLGGGNPMEAAESDSDSSAPEIQRVQSMAEYASGQMVRMRKRARVLPAILFVAVVVLGVIAATRGPSTDSLETIINRGEVGVLASAKLTRQEEAILDFAAVGGGAGETFTCRLPEGQAIKEFGAYRFVGGKWLKCPFWEGSSEMALFSMSYRGSTVQVNFYDGSGVVGMGQTYFEEGEASITAFAGSDATENPAIQLAPGTFMVPVVWGGTAEDEMIGPMVPVATEAEWLAHRENPGPTEVRVCLYITIE